MPDPQLLTKGVVSAQAIGAGATYTMLGPEGLPKINCEGDSTLVVQADMTGGAGTDLAVSVFPYVADGATLSGVALPIVGSTGPTLAGGHVYYYAQCDLSAVDAIQIQIKNNNAGGQTITRASWRLA